MCMCLEIVYLSMYVRGICACGRSSSVSQSRVYGGTHSDVCLGDVSREDFLLSRRKIGCERGMWWLTLTPARAVVLHLKKKEERNFLLWLWIPESSRLFVHVCCLHGWVSQQEGGSLSSSSSSSSSTSSSMMCSSQSFTESEAASLLLFFFLCLPLIIYQCITRW